MPAIDIHQGYSPKELDRIGSNKKYIKGEWYSPNGGCGWG